MSYDYSNDYTTICSFWSTIDDQRDACHCKGDFYSYHEECYCDLPENPRLNVVKILLRVLGNPIKFRPSDCTYNVVIWERDTTYNEMNKDIFDYSDPITEFSLSSVIDEVDLERLFNSYLKRYFLERNFEEILSSQRFSAPCSIQGYISGFKSIVDKAVHGTSRKTQGEECSHVKRRKKRV